MADLITQATQNVGGCGHWTLQGLDDGQAWTEAVHDGELLQALTTEEKTLLRRLLLRYLRQKGITLAQFLNRVVRGEEATNVKITELVGRGAVITLTNMGGTSGTAYINVLPGTNAQRAPVDFTGCTQVYVQGCANLPGVGPYNFRILTTPGDVVVYESPNVAAGGERELDSNWQALPGGLTGLLFVRLQIKSATGTDDPVVRGVAMGVR